MAGDNASNLILASGSPRRKDLLRTAGLTFRVLVPEVDEPPCGAEDPKAYVQRLALEKAEAVARLAPPGDWILAADTVVVLDSDVLGKPRDADEAVKMLLRIGGRSHRVLTAFALLRAGAAGGKERKIGVEQSGVRVRPIRDEEARAYVATGEPLDKAGAYALQGRGEHFVESVEGSRSNVIGLPLERVLPILDAVGFRAAGERAS